MARDQMTEKLVYLAYNVHIQNSTLNRRKQYAAQIIKIFISKISGKHDIFRRRNFLKVRNAKVPLETILHAFRNQEKTKQRSTIV